MVRVLADVDRLVADAFQLGRDARSHEQEPDVGGDRLLQGGERDRAVVDLDLQVVDFPLFAMDLGTARFLALDQRPHGGLNHGLRKAAHEQQLLEQLLHLFIEVTLHLSEPP